MIFLYRTLKKVLINFDINLLRNVCLGLLCKGIFCLCFCLFLAPANSFSSETIEPLILLKAIRKAENNPNYGVLSVPCHSEKECRQICLNSIRNSLKRYEKSKKDTDFIAFFSKRWCPTFSPSLSPTEKKLNPNFEKNLRAIYHKEKNHERISRKPSQPKRNRQSV